MLSIVFITCNRKKEMLIAMKSCVDHTQRVFEFVVVDNASTDGSQEEIKHFCSDRKVKLIYEYLDQNMGVSFARNRGYNLAMGDILFFMDDDAIIISDSMSLDNVYDYFIQHPDVYAITGTCIDARYGGKIQFIQAKGSKSAHDRQHILRYVGFSHFIRKGFSEKHFIYPSNLFYGSEELYMGLSVLRYGGKVVQLSEHVVEHHPSINTRINRREGTKNGHINTFVIKKYFLPHGFRMISRILFWARIMRFTKFNVREMRECYSKTKERYDSQYEQIMTVKEMLVVIREFGVLSIL